MPSGPRHLFTCLARHCHHHCHRHCHHHGNSMDRPYQAFSPVYELSWFPKCPSSPRLSACPGCRMGHHSPEKVTHCPLVAQPEFAPLNCLLSPMREGPPGMQKPVPANRFRGFSLGLKPPPACCTLPASSEPRPTKASASAWFGGAGSHRAQWLRYFKANLSCSHCSWGWRHFTSRNQPRPHPVQAWRQPRRLTGD